MSQSTSAQFAVSYQGLTARGALVPFGPVYANSYGSIHTAVGCPRWYGAFAIPYSYPVHSTWIGSPVGLYVPAYPVFQTAPGPIFIGLNDLINPGPEFRSLPGAGIGSLASSPAETEIDVVPSASRNQREVFPSSLIGRDPSQRPVTESSTASKLKSLERQALGDSKLRKQQWLAAYGDFRVAVDAAPDRAEAHFRLGCVFVAMNRFSSAVREFKRAVYLDALLPQTGDRLSAVFGPDSQVARSTFLNRAADWLREDIRDPDRLFLLAVLLHFEDDARSREIFEAARRMANQSGVFADHIIAFLNLPTESVPGSESVVPSLNGENRNSSSEGLPKLISEPVPNVGPASNGSKSNNLNPVPPSPIPDLQGDNRTQTLPPAPAPENN